jgi:ATP-binding cassette subfamily F protein 3
MITLDRVSLRYGSKVLYNEISCLIGERDRISLVGPNGAGKTTLFRLLLGQEDSDSGQVEMAKHVNVGYLPQEHIVSHGKTLFKEVESSFVDILGLRAKIEAEEALLAKMDTNSEEYLQSLDSIGTWEHRLADMDEHKLASNIEKILFGLGFSEADLEKDTGEFSGGWQMRIALAKLLLKKPSLLLLDEPTNHLDISSQRWLENQLRQYEGAIIIISHDQGFIDGLCNRTYALHQGRLEIYEGNYSYYKRESVARRELELRQYENQQKQIQKTEDFIERFRAKATKAKQVQSRIKALDKVERIELTVDSRTVHFKFPPAPRSGQIVMSLENLTKSFGDKQVFRGIDLKIDRGDKIAIVGPNGCGKSTLSRIIAGEESLTGGIREVGHNVHISFFAQHQANVLDGELNLVETLESDAQSRDGIHIRSILGTFLFKGDDVFKKVKVLSGGEKSRLAMAKILCRVSNCLILDEPTNHIDMDTKEILQRALIGYEGTCLIVSHDRLFLDPIINKVIEVTHNGIRFFPGNISSYLEEIEREEIEEEVLLKGPRKNSGNNSKEKRRARAELQKNISPLRKKAQILESEIEKMEGRIAELENLMADPAFFAKGGAETTSAVAEHAKLQDRVPQKYEEWEKLEGQIKKMEEELEDL